MPNKTDEPSHKRHKSTSTTDAYPEPPLNTANFINALIIRDNGEADYLLTAYQMGFADLEVHALYNNVQTPLAYAIRANSMSITYRLITLLEVNVNTLDNHGNSPLTLLALAIDDIVNSQDNDNTDWQQSMLMSITSIRDLLLGNAANYIIDRAIITADNVTDEERDRYEFSIGNITIEEYLERTYHHTQEEEDDDEEEDEEEDDDEEEDEEDEYTYYSNNEEEESEDEYYDDDSDKENHYKTSEYTGDNYGDNITIALAPLGTVMDSLPTEVNIFYYASY